MGKQQTISLKQRRRTSSNKPLHKTTHVKPRLAATIWFYGGSDEHRAAWRLEGESPFGRGTNPEYRE